MQNSELNTKISKIKFLLVENDKKNAAIFSSILREYGFCNFEFVTNTTKAFEIIENESVIDMVILNPGIATDDKLAFCKTLRSNYAYDNLRVLLESRIDEFDQIKAALKYPAVDLICEPINQYNLMAWLKQHAENRVLLHDTNSYREKMQAELEQARQMQNLILPKSESISQMEDKYRIKVSSYFETCDITGGDFWGIEPISRDIIGFYIVDCTGHGVTAALNTFRMHAVMKDIDDIEIKLNPDLYLSYLNKKMCSLFAPGQFATMFYGLIDTKSNMLTYSAAASTQPLLIREHCAAIEKLACEGYLLGIQKNVSYDVHEISFNKGDKVLLYSDALIEKINSTGEMYGEERLLKSAAKAPECKDGVNLLAKIIDEFSDYCATPLADDLTVNIYTRV